MRKKLLTLGMACFAFLFAGVMGVHAETYDETHIYNLITSKTPITVNAGDTLKVGETVYVGEGSDSLMNVTEGNAEISYDGSRVKIELKGTADINVVKVIMQLPYSPESLPIDLVVDEGATLNVNGGMALPTGTKGTLTNNGTVNINGNLEVRANATYTGTGVTNLRGNFVFYGTENNLGDTEIAMHTGGKVYSYADISKNLVVASDYEIIESEEKDYTSVTEVVGKQTFTYAYTTKALETEESATDEDTETTTEETPVKDEVENPKTSDGIILVVGSLALSVVIAFVAKKKLA